MLRVSRGYCMPCLCAALLIRGIDVALKQPAVLAGHGGSTPLALAVASYRPGEASHWEDTKVKDTLSRLSPLGALSRLSL